MVGFTFISANTNHTVVLNNNEKKDKKEQMNDSYFLFIFICIVFALIELINRMNLDLQK